MKAFPGRKAAPDRGTAGRFVRGAIQMTAFVRISKTRPFSTANWFKSMLAPPRRVHPQASARWRPNRAISSMHDDAGRVFFLGPAQTRSRTRTRAYPTKLSDKPDPENRGRNGNIASPQTARAKQSLVPVSRAISDQQERPWEWASPSSAKIFAASRRNTSELA